MFLEYINFRIQSRFPIKDLATSNGCVVESSKGKANAFNRFFQVFLLLKIVAHCLTLV